MLKAQPGGGGGPEVIAGMRLRVGGVGRAGTGATVWTGTAPENTTAFRKRVLRPRGKTSSSKGAAETGGAASTGPAEGDEGEGAEDPGESRIGAGSARGAAEDEGGVGGWRWRRA